MYNKAFIKALSFTLKAQNYYPLSYENKNEEDVNFGITQNQYDIYRFLNKQKLRSVKLIESKEIEKIYLYIYWYRGGCHLLTYKVSIIHFDWSVHKGIVLAAKSIQQLLNTTINGIIFKEETIKTIKQNLNNDFDLAEKYLKLRERWYKKEITENYIEGINIENNLNRIKELKKIL